MVGHRDYGKGAGPNHIHLCHLGTYATSPSHWFPVWQRRIGCCYQQRLLKRHSCNAHPMFSMVFIAHFDIAITAAHLPGVINIIADHLSCGKLKISLPVQPRHVSEANSLTTLDLPHCLPARSQLGFPSIPTAVPRNLIITSPDISALLTQQHEYLHIIYVIIYVLICFTHSYNTTSQYLLWLTFYFMYIIE